MKTKYPSSRKTYWIELLFVKVFIVQNTFNSICKHYIFGQITSPDLCQLAFINYSFVIINQSTYSHINYQNNQMWLLESIVCSGVKVFPVKTTTAGVNLDFQIIRENSIHLVHAIVLLNVINTFYHSNPPIPHLCVLALPNLITYYYCT
jgi:hypothetical protein